MAPDIPSDSGRDTPGDSAPGTPGEPGAKPLGERIVDQDIEDELKESYLTYAMSVIVARALPDARTASSHPSAIRSR
jgi:DNA gyrase subunit A